eukprot:TRINITY_DN48979_c0_g1_i2.p1 TRINITY_DN48979_c0_g1~~TRINITY_DN48979_c0_g1_i2.p1  ORF type:complete len:3687 (-),score=844.41 TRINITY_DN48979_c0_g1_i2:271-11331(-)
MLAIAVLPQYAQLRLGRHLRDFVLQLSRLDGSLTHVAAMSRCSDFNGVDDDAYAQHVAELDRDRTLALHRSGGAACTIVRNYRPEDTANRGHGVLVSYDLSARTLAISADHMTKAFDVSAGTLEDAFGALRLCGFIFERDADMTWMELGMDSMDISSLARTLGISEAVLFDQTTPRKLLQALNSERADDSRRSIPEVAASGAGCRTGFSVVIPGVACCLPAGASCLSSFTQALVAGVDSVTDAASLWGAGYEGAFLEPAACCTDLAAFGLSSAEAESMDPHQLLALEVCEEAYKNSSMSKEAFGSQTGIFLGHCNDEWMNMVAAAAVTAYTGTGTARGIAAGRISYHLNIFGPSLVVDTSCSSALAAVHSARSALAVGDCEAALAAAADLMLSPRSIDIRAAAGMLSAVRRCKTFDQAADGYGRGEGGAALMLVPGGSATIEKEGVLASIASTALNQDGHSVSLTAPSGVAQRSVILEALRRAGATPESVGLVEAHGTGTALGDPIEFRALAGVHAGRIEPLLLSSVKTNIGHLEGAAGMAGLLKTISTMAHWRLPSHLHLKALNPVCTVDDIDILVPTEVTPLENCSCEVRAADAAAAGAQRNLLAGVSAFGFSGTNGHAILEAVALPGCSGKRDAMRLRKWPRRRDGRQRCWWQRADRALGVQAADAEEEKAAEEEDSDEELLGALMPASGLRQIVLEAIRGLLPGVAAVAESADLISLGLDSLGAAELAQRLHGRLGGRGIPAHGILMKPTIRDICTSLDDVLKAGGGLGQGLRRRTSSSLMASAETYAASSLQEGMLFHQLADDCGQMFLETFRMDIAGVVNPACLGAAWARVVALVPQLRARFNIPCHLTQTITSNSSVSDRADVASPLPDFYSVFDMRAAAPDTEQAIEEHIQKDRAKGISPDDAPLLRVALLLLGDKMSTLVVTIHHLVVDGWSWRVLLHLLEQEYMMVLATMGHTAAVLELVQNVGRPTACVSTPLPSFASIVQFETHADATAALSYWSSQLQDVERVLRRQRLMVANLAGRDVLRRKIFINSDDAALLRQLASRHGVTLAAVMQAAWYAAYSAGSLCDEDEVVFGYTTSRRSMPVRNIQSIVGPVVNTLPLRLRAEDDTPVTLLLRKVHEQLLRNSEHDWLPLARIQEAAHHRGLFDTIVDVQQDDQWRCQLGPAASACVSELVDCIGMPLSLRILLRRDGPIKVTAMSETTSLGERGLDSVLGSFHSALLFLATAREDDTLGGLRRKLAPLRHGSPDAATSRRSEEDKETDRAKEELKPPEVLLPPQLPLRAVPQGTRWQHHQGRLPEELVGNDGALLHAYAAALHHWSSSVDRFAVWTSSAAATSGRLQAVAVDRGAAASQVPAAGANTEVVLPEDAKALACLQLDAGSVPLVEHVFCFHAAGASSAQFARLEARLQECRGPRTTLVDLPGHGKRRHEQPLTSMADVVAAVLAEHSPSMAEAAAGGGYMLLGVSFGALVAYEVAKALEALGRGPKQLVLLSQAAPATAAINFDLDDADEQLVEVLHSRGWLSEEVVSAGASSWHAILPLVRTDLEVEAKYADNWHHESSGSAALSCPLVVLAGSDDHYFTEALDGHVAAWSSLTTASVQRAVVAGASHGFVDLESGVAATLQALTGCCLPVPCAVRLCVAQERWSLHGDVGLLHAQTVAGIARSFQRVLSALSGSSQEVLQTVLPCNWAAAPFPDAPALQDTLLHDMWNSAATTESTGVVDYSKEGLPTKLTYKEFLNMSKHVALELLGAGLMPGDVAAVVALKGAAQLAGAVGILQAGGTYLPIDPKQVPAERALQILRMASTEALVSEERVCAAFSWLREADLPVITSSVRLAAEPIGEALEAQLDNLARRRRPGDPAYLLYTSGSTGVPKGVSCHHQGAVNTCLDLNRRFRLDASDKVLALSSLSFDLSVYDLFGTAAAGGCIVVPHHETTNPPDPAAWLSLIKDEGVTLVNAVPAFLELLVGYCEASGQTLPSTLRLVWMSGDWCPLNLPYRIKSLGEGEVAVVVLGGATEAAIWSNMYVVPEEPLSEWRSIPYGRPLGNQGMLVLNETSKALEPCAPWVTGMIYITGAGVALGYLGDAEKTNASFVTLPLTGERAYRTGDLGRLRPALEVAEEEELLIEILGREDSQVKLNGFRIELGEVEAVMLALPGIEEVCASVLAASDAGGSSQRLAAFFRGQALDGGSVREKLQQLLPSQLVPAVVVRVEERFPLNSNGKVDKKKLAALHAEAISSGSVASSSKNVTAPVGETERKLQVAAGEVLGVGAAQVCCAANLFSIGLDSLRSLRLVSAALRCGLQLSVRDVFAHPTLRELATVARAISSEKAQEIGNEKPVFAVSEPSDESTQPFPLTGITKAYWTGLWHNPYSPSGCRPQIAFEFDWEGQERIDVSRLGRAFDALVARHPGFRAVVLQEMPCMRYLAKEEVSAIKFSEEELSEADDVDAACDAAYHRIFDEHIDCFSFPLLKGHVLHLPGNRGSRFYYCVSLFIMDGITDLTWRREISTLYRQQEDSLLPSPPKLTLKAYNDAYLDEKTGMYQSAKWQAARDYWQGRTTAGDLPEPPQVPTLKPSTSNCGTFSHHGAPPLTQQQLAALKRNAAQFGLTPTAVLLALYCVSLSRHAASSRMLINVLHCVRHPVHEDFERVLGNFSSSLLVPVDVGGGDGSLLSTARRAMESLAECQAHNAISGVDVMSLLNSRNAAHGAAVAPFIFVSAMGLEAAVPDWQGLCFRERRVTESTSGTYMVHAVKEYPDGSMYTGFNVIDGAFAPDILAGLVADHEALLRFVTQEASPGSWDVKVSSLLQPLPEPRAVAAAPVFPETQLLHDALFEHALRCPAATAIRDLGQDVELCYEEVARRSLAVVKALRQSGMAAYGDSRYGAPLVAVVCEKSWQQVVACLAILAAGCAYLPVNVGAWPRKRIEAVLEAGEVVAIVSNGATLGRRLPWLQQDQQVPVVNVDAAVSSLPELAERKDLEVRRRPDVLAYCIFTSGSTGQPKGVAMAHDAVLNTLHALRELHSLDASLVTFGISQLSFDLSVSDIFLSFLVGGCLALPPETSLSPPAPAEWLQGLRQCRATLWNSVPALLEVVCEQAEHAGETLPQEVQMAWVSGDMVTEGLPSRVRGLAAPGLKLFAMGGATEAGIWSNLVDITSHMPTDGPVSYGRPLPGQGMHVVRLEDYSVAAPGVSGMIAISGKSLMMGYYNDAATTSKAIAEVAGRKLYLTQDGGFMRWQKGGELENMITGRIQGQQDGYVKIRGFRVELSEVEVVLRSHPDVKAAAVAAHGGALVGYVVADPNVERELVEHMRLNLPVYALAKKIVYLESLPMSSNGKIDRNALPKPSAENCGSSSGRHNGAGSASEAAVLKAAIDVGIRVAAASDDIFEKGGDSVAALRLMLKVQKQFGVQLDVGRFFGEGSIAGIAALVDDAAGKVGNEAVAGGKGRLELSKLASGAADRPPLFLCHGAGTTALALSRLAGDLSAGGSHGDIFGISDSFLLNSTCEFGFRSIEEAADCMASLIGTSSEVFGTPLATLSVGGWSYGGVVALECARLLEARGTNIKRVVMLDAPVGQTAGATLSGENLKSLQAAAGEDVAARAAEHFEACNDLLAAYRPLEGPRLRAALVLDVRPEESEVDFLSQGQWRKLAAKWCRVYVDGADHFSLVQAPYTKEVAEALES